MKRKLPWPAGLLLAGLFLQGLADVRAAPPEGGASVMLDRGDGAMQYVLELPATSAADVLPGSVTFIGAATVLIRYGSLTILTDPSFLHKGDRADLGYDQETERLVAPAVPFEQLPPVDLVLLSHLHGDHFDRLVQRKLDRRIPIVTNRQAAEALEQLGFDNGYGLATWDALSVKKGETLLRVTALPARHGPAAVAPLLPEVMGAMLEFSAGGRRDYRIYVSGDTVVHDGIREIPRRYPAIDLALLHLGGMRMFGMKMTMDGEDGTHMLRIAAPERAIPLHYGDYDAYRSPFADFERTAQAAGLQHRIVHLAPGESHRFVERR